MNQLKLYKLITGISIFIVVVLMVGIIEYSFIGGNHHQGAISKGNKTVFSKAVAAESGSSGTVDHQEPATVVPVSKANAIITKMSNGQSSVATTFAGPQGLTGMVIRTTHGKVIGWLTDNLSAVILGGVVDVKTDQNVSLQATSAYIITKQSGDAATSSTASAAYSTPSVSSSAQVSSGKLSPTADPANTADTAASGEKALVSFLANVNNYTTINQPGVSGSNTLYAFVDPNCIFCHDFFEFVQHNKSKFNHYGVKVVYVPVATLKQSSVGKAAAEAQGGWPALLADERGFNVNTEEGGIKGLTGEALIKYATPIHENTNLMTYLSKENGVDNIGTPFLVWKAGNKHVYYMDGYPSAKGMSKIFESFQSNWTPSTK